MSGDHRPEKPEDAEAVPDAKPGCVALVPLVQPAQSPRNPRGWSPNSNFVTHLIATAEHAPQTRGLRRASFADAKTAYHASQRPVRAAGIRTRQVI